MRKKSIILLIILTLLIFNCERNERNPSVKTEFIDGIQHVFNTGEPIKGEISLEVAEILRIDPFKIDLEDPPLFQMVVKDDTGNLYLSDRQNIKVYKLDSSGKLITQFLRKGQGPV